MLVSVLPLLAEGKRVYIITHLSVEENSVNARTLNKILLGTKKKWDSGGYVRIAILKEVAGYTIMEYSGVNEHRFIEHWKRLVFTGKGSLPKICESEEELIQYVNETPGSIGLVTLKPSPKVKEITIDKN